MATLDEATQLQEVVDCGGRVGRGGGGAGGGENRGVGWGGAGEGSVFLDFTKVWGGGGGMGGGGAGSIFLILQRCGERGVRGVGFPGF